MAYVDLPGTFESFSAFTSLDSIHALEAQDDGLKGTLTWNNPDPLWPPWDGSADLPNFPAYTGDEAIESVQLVISAKAPSGGNTSDLTNVSTVWPAPATYPSLALIPQPFGSLTQPVAAVPIGGSYAEALSGPIPEAYWASFLSGTGTYNLHAVPVAASPHGTIQITVDYVALRLTFAETPPPTESPVTRLFPRDDAYGLGSAPRIFPPPRGRRIVGGQT